MTPITVIYGTRPEAIKLEPVVRVLRAKGAQVFVVSTGQHTDLLDDVKLKPDIDLKLMVDGQAPENFLTKALAALNAFHTTHPTCFYVVQGDTATAFAGALTGFHKHVPVAHVEAGLRTYDLAAPFPEEGYRQMIDRIASRLYAPTKSSYNNLISEGCRHSDIVVTGNTGIDALCDVLKSNKGQSYATERQILVTVHRRESFGNPLMQMCDALVDIVRKTKLHVIIPVHPNPNVSEILKRHLLNVPNIRLIKPLSHADLIQTMRDAFCVVTDSGGIQEEATFLGVPLFVTRECTERQEAVETKNAVLVGYGNKLVEAVVKLHTYPQLRTIKPNSVFGDGKASDRIADDLIQHARSI